MAVTYTKNLLLKDKKDRLSLLAINEDLVVDRKKSPTRIGASGRLGLASGKCMVEMLGVGPGALTPLSLIIDVAGLVTPVVDVALLDAKQMNFHPMVNRDSMCPTPAGLPASIRSCNRDPVLVDFSTEAAAS